jgi:hypothetical protein
MIRHSLDNRAQNVNAIALRHDPLQDFDGWTGPRGDVDIDGNLYALSNCGTHYGHYPPANVYIGDLPCRRGCASPVFATAA